MAARVGQQFPARMVRVKSFGLVAQLDEMRVKGVVSSDGLPGSPLRPDARELSRVGKERAFTSGMQANVKVASTDE